MTRQELKKIITPIVKEILIECLSGSSRELPDIPKNAGSSLRAPISKENIEERRKIPSKTNSVISENKKRQLREEHLMEMRSEMEQNSIQFVPNKAKLVAKPNSSLLEGIMSKLDESDFKDNLEQADDYESDAVIESMADVWKQFKE